jgi:multicomponent Na+:H+ antiporter subunit A
VQVFALVVAHLAVAALLPLLRARRTAFVVAALLPSATLVWALLNVGAVEVVPWAPALGLEFAFRLDAAALAMVVLVSGIGALILLYCVGYFGPDSEEAPRTGALLLAFAGAMLGLVLADDLLTLYVFWELTSVASFLLVGQSGATREARRAAVQALLVTVLGGLAMLLGFVLLGTAAGTYRISEIVAAPPSGPLLVPALLLILVGAFTKSAQLPFHPWLPAAMVAPTPVSAYLHAASMVKAGVFLVARLTPAFGGLAVWWGPIVGFGIATMLLGGWRALREHDLKRILAFGTVSQLGFLMTLVGAGGRDAALAGVAMLLAHGLFKAPLFLVVGTIDHATGTRDIRRLSGLARALPGTFVIATLSAASMAGLPPLLGFVAKEAAFEAFLHDGRWPITAGLVLGSALTVAYTARLLIGAFGTSPDAASGPSQQAEMADPAAGLVAASGAPRPARPAVHRPGPWLTVPAAVCAVAGLALGLVPGPVDALAAAYAGPGEYHLALWHGFGLPLLLTALVLAAGLAAWRLLRPPTFWPLDAQRGYERTVAGLGRVAVTVTGRLQTGSLPVYLGTILAVVVLLPGVAALAGTAWPAAQPLVHDLVQVPLALAAVLAAVALVRCHRRFTAVLLVGVIGYAVGGLFVVDGAPDLALAQFLVETLSLVVFVFVLRRLPAHFVDRPVARPAALVKAAVAIVGGVTVAGLAVVASAARSAPSATAADFARLARDGAGADNVVAAIIVDFRALDTVGEIAVLFVAAAGVASLVLATRYDRRVRGEVVTGQGSPHHEEDVLG